MKHIKTRKLIICCALVAVILISSAFAILQSADSRVNRFTSGTLTLEVTETDWSEINAQNMAPNQTVAKNPKIFNPEGNIDAWTMISVKIPSTNVSFEGTTAPTAIGADGTTLKAANVGTYYDLFIYTTNSDWELVAIDASKRNQANGYTTYYYVYKTEELKGNATTKSALFNSITLANIEGAPSTSETSIDVQGFGIQKEAIDSVYQAWAILSNQNTLNTNLTYYKTGFSVSGSDNVAKYSA